VGRHRLPRCSTVRDCQDESHVPSESLRQSDTLELGGSQLGLQVAEASLNLDQHDLLGARENHVRRSAVGRRRHWNLKADSPGAMRRGPNQFGQPKLAGVAEPDPVCRVQTHGKMLPDPTREASHRTQVGGNRAPLDPADHRLADACTRGKPTLRQPRRSASVAHLLAESLDDVAAAHGSSIG
jgi:hypothetical protein